MSGFTFDLSSLTDVEREMFLYNVRQGLGLESGTPSAAQIAHIYMKIIRRWPYKGNPSVLKSYEGMTDHQTQQIAINLYYSLIERAVKLTF